MRFLLAFMLLAGLVLLGTGAAVAAPEARGEHHWQGHGWHGYGHGLAPPAFYPVPLPAYYPVPVPIEVAVPVEVAIPVAITQLPPYNLPPPFAGYPLGP